MRRPCLGRLTVFELCIPINRRCLWLRPALHGRSTSDRFVLEWHYLCEKLGTFGNHWFFHLRSEFLCFSNSNNPAYRIWRNDGHVYFSKYRFFAWKRQKLGGNCFYQTWAQRISPSFCLFQAKNLFWKQICPAFSLGYDVLLHFGYPKINFESS